MLRYSDLPSGLLAEIADLRPLDIRSTEKPTIPVATSRFIAIMSQQGLVYTIISHNASKKIKKLWQVSIFNFFQFPHLSEKSLLAWVLPLDKRAAVWTSKVRMSHTGVFIPMLRKSFFTEMLESGKI